MLIEDWKDEKSFYQNMILKLFIGKEKIILIRMHSHILIQTKKFLTLT
jgi:hypothetical protein